MYVRAKVNMNILANKTRQSTPKKVPKIMNEKDSSKKLYLIDVSGLIFRAFHSIPPTMTNPENVPINSVFGVCSMLTGLRNTFKNDYVVAVFDAGKRTFRNDIYGEYKAHRPPLPEELIPQFPLIRDAINAFGLPVVEKIGYEADDVIATLATQAKKDDVQVIIVSSDKDLMQLVNDKVSMLDTMKHKKITINEVLEKFGVSPEKVIEVQALSGDSADNIPGIPGIGPKISAQLINEFGDIETLMEKAHDSSFTHKLFTKKRRENLQEFTDDAHLSKKLVTLVTDVPLDHEYSYYSTEISDDNLYDFYFKHGFKSLINKLKVSKNKIIESEKNAHANTNDNNDNNNDNNSQALSSSYDYVSFAKQFSNIEKNYRAIETISELKAFMNVAKNKPILAFDTETTSLDALQADLVGISLSHSMGEAVYIPFAHVWQKENANENENEKEKSGDLFLMESDEPIIKENTHKNEIDSKDLIINNISQAYEILRDVLEDKTILKIAHNTKYDTKILSNPKNGDINVYPMDDTLVMSYVLDSTSHKHSLDELAKLYFNHDMIKFSDLMGKGKNKLANFSYVNKQDAIEYGAEDSDYAFRLYAVLKHRMNNEKMARMYEFFERPLIDVLNKMESRGIHVDKNQLLELEKEFTLKSNELQSEIYEIAGTEFNIGSPKQLGEILFEHMGYKGGAKTKAGAWKTDEKILHKLAKEGTCESLNDEDQINFPNKIIAWREVEKLKNTYVLGLLSAINENTNRVHTSYLMTGTSTGRLSSSNPNLQNIPIRTEAGQKIRKVFIAKKDHMLISVDYSQVELRLLAHVADVESLKYAFHNGIDVHSLTASQAFGMPLEDVSPDDRRKAKSINFGIVYGMGAFGLAGQLGISNGEAKSYIDAYFKQYPGIQSYMAKQKDLAHKYPFVTTFQGRKCALPELKPRFVTNVERVAINSPIQGGAADIIKRAMINVEKTLSEKYATLGAELLLQVHDELIIESPKDKAEEVSQIVKVEMEKITQELNVSIPLIADIGIADNWYDAH